MPTVTQIFIRKIPIATEEVMKRLLSYAKPYRAATILAVICIVTEAFLELIIPMIMADMVDIGVANGDRQYIFMKGLQMAVCAVAAMLLGTGSARFAAVCGQGKNRR